MPVAACVHADLGSVNGRHERQPSPHFFSAAASTFLQAGASLSFSLARQAIMRPPPGGDAFAIFLVVAHAGATLFGSHLPARKAACDMPEHGGGGQDGAVASLLPFLGGRSLRCDCPQIRPVAFLLLDRGPAVVKLRLAAARKTREKPMAEVRAKWLAFYSEHVEPVLQGNIFSRREVDHRDVDRIGRRPCLEQ